MTRHPFRLGTTCVVLALVSRLLLCGPPARAQTIADDLTQRILHGNIDDATAAVTEAFARAGIATRSLSHEVRAAVPPTFPAQLYDFQARLFALDARTRASGGWRLTLRELGAALREAGWKLSPERDPAALLTAVLGLAIRKAQQEPDNPHSFTPLFLLAMARATTPGVDLVSGTDNPGKIRLSLMEAELLLAAHLRAAKSYTLADVGGRGDPLLEESSLHGLLAQVSELAAPRAAYAEDPCQVFQDVLDKIGPLKLVKDMVLILFEQETDIPFKKLYEEMGLDEATLQGKAMRFALSNILNVVNLVNTMASIQFDLKAEPTTQHYSNEEGAKEIKFIATAQAWDMPEPYKSLMDCMKLAGLPTHVDAVNDILKGAKVRWYPQELGQHATWGLAKNHLDQHAPPVTFLGTDLTAQFVADMKPEPFGVHRTGDKREDESWFTAQLDVSEFPGLRPLLQVATNPEAAPDAVLELLIGWYKQWFGPKRTVEVTVTWHEKPRPQCAAALGAVKEWTGSISATYNDTFTYQHPNDPEHQYPTDLHESTEATFRLVNPSGFTWWTGIDAGGILTGNGSVNDRQKVKSRYGEGTAADYQSTEPALSRWTVSLRVDQHSCQYDFVFSAPMVPYNGLIYIISGKRPVSADLTLSGSAAFPVHGVGTEQDHYFPAIHHMGSFNIPSLAPSAAQVSWTFTPQGIPPVDAPLPNDRPPGDPPSLPVS